MSSTLHSPDAYATATCAECLLEQTLGAHFELAIETTPIAYFDFCVSCAKAAGGYQALYRKHRRNERINHALADKAAPPKVVDSSPLEPSSIAERELARRELARRRLVVYISQFFKDYKAGWVHHDICRRLEKFVQDVEQGLSPRLILTVPPRHGKSLILSDLFVSWALGKHPMWEIISASYAIALPIKFSRNIRDRLRDPQHHALFPECKLRADTQGVEEWRLTAGGGYRAAGVGVGVTGMGAHIAIVDDPFKDDQEAQSETIRSTVKDWFTSTLSTRLAPGGGILIIQTRWHDDDLAGYCIRMREELLASGAPSSQIDDWEVVSYPAIALHDEYLFPDGEIRHAPDEVPDGARLLRPAGEALHPARYPLDDLLRIKNRMPPRQWNALYQQDPVPDDGDYFAKDMFRYVQGLPGLKSEYTYVMAWDLAIGEKQQNDWTVGVVMAYNADGDVFLVDMVRGRFGTQQIVGLFCDMIQKWDVQRCGMEHGHIKMTLWPLVVDEMRKRRITCSIDEDLKPIKDKMTRARPLQSLFQTGRVYFLSGLRFTERVEAELLRFPSGTNDDIVDALAWVALMCRRIPRPKFTHARGKKQAAKSWKTALKAAKAPTGKSYMTA